MELKSGEIPQVGDSGFSLFDVLRGFLKAQRKDLFDPRDLAPGVTILRFDDDGQLVNCYVTYDPPAGGDAPDLAGLLSHAGIDPLRTEIVVPDSLAGRLAELQRTAGDLARTVRAMSEFLDSFLRPHQICYELVGKPDREPFPRGSRSGPPMFEATLLNEDDWIPLDAIVPHTGTVAAQQYLHSEWARGASPRLCIVLAPAGHGKSKVTHILAKRLARNYQEYERAPEGDRPPLPILIPFGRYPRGTSSFDGLVLRFMDAFGVAKLTAEAFRYLIALGRILFILDGYDEMVEASPDVAAENIAEFVREAGPDSRILLTTRSTFYRTSSDVVGQIADPFLSEDEVEVIDLQPFSKLQAKEYIKRRLGEQPDRSRALERAQEIVDEEWNPDILGSPIFLFEFVNLIAEGKWSRADVRERGFLEYLIERTFARERERQHHDFTDQQQRLYLERIAFDLLTTDVTGYERELLEVVAMEVVGEDMTLHQDWPTLWRGLATHYFLLPDDDAAEHPVATMRHQVWRDYFQGSALGTQLNAGDKKALAALTSRDLPEGVLRSADGRMSPTTRAVLTARIDASDDKFVRNLLRMTLLRQAAGNQLTQLPPEIARHLARRDLSDIVFRRVAFEGSLAGTNLTACFFEGCDLSGASFSRALLNRTDFRHCQLSPDSFQDADVASLTIDGEVFFGPQLAAQKEQEAPAEAAAPGAAARATAKDDVRAWVIGLLRARLAKFVVARGGEANAGLDTSISWNAFLGGTDPKDRDFVVRRLYRALSTENVIKDAPTGMTTRRTVFLGPDPQVRAEVLALVRDSKVGPSIEAVIERLVR
jgi:uncharacterized protein YjbI with pentapeptide repeats